MKDWVVINTDIEVHVIPNDDSKKHLESEKCWCKPRIEFYDKNLVVHNSTDKREYFEDDTKKTAEIIN